MPCEVVPFYGENNLIPMRTIDAYLYFLGSHDYTDPMSDNVRQCQSLPLHDTLPSRDTNTSEGKNNTIPHIAYSASGYSIYSAKS